MGNGTSIGRVRGLGSSHEGSHHWLGQRYTAIGNLFLGVWLVASIILLPDLEMSTVTAWLTGPVPGTAMILLIVSTFYHARLGLQVVIEDYVHDDANRFAALAALNLVAIAGATFGIFCVLKVALGGAA
ncbi:MAG TPA: succinate dehydrogenase, hydrophobic membrane anchor protein [Sphingomonadaceae bacterium]|nr:succinate dehydrogenase, hydrophobic membrane anchor protein [Sphingomonadaceae bacterium]